MSDCPRVGRLAGSSLTPLALLYVALFGAFGTESPFFPSYLAARDLTSREIAAVLTAGTIVRIATGPAIGLLADRVGLRTVLSAACLGSGALILLYPFANGFLALALVAASHAIAIGPLNPLCDALAIEACRRDQLYPYGWIRGIGSAAFVLATILSGPLVARCGLASVLTVAAGLFLLMLPPLMFIPPSTEWRKKVSARDALLLLEDGVFLRMLLVAGLVIGSQAMSDTFAVIHWRTHGLGTTAASLLWSEAVVAEIVVFLIIGPILLRLSGPWQCAMLSAAAGVVRWTIFAVSTDVLMLMVAQALQGLTFALMHLACMAFIGEAVPARLAATAQAVYGTLALGGAAAILTLVSGEAYSRFGSSAFWSMAALCLVALFVAAAGTPPNDRG